MPAEDSLSSFDPARILDTLDAHRVDYLLVGGFAAAAHGSLRQTIDFDLVPQPSEENYERLAAALRQLSARLRVGGMTDEEARQLPVQVDGRTLRSFGNSTWTTDAGAVDILLELPDRDGQRHTYDELASRHITQRIGGVVVQVASLDDIVASKEFADRPKDHEALPELRELQTRPESESGLDL